MTDCPAGIGQEHLDAAGAVHEAAQALNHAVYEAIKLGLRVDLEAIPSTLNWVGDEHDTNRVIIKHTVHFPLNPKPHNAVPLEGP